MTRMRKIVITSKEYTQNWESWMNDFLSLKRAEKKSNTTVNDYEYHIRQFFKRYPSGDLEKNLYDYLSEDIALATFNLRLTYLKGFFNYLVNEYLISKNPLSKIHRKKTEPRIVDIDIDILQKLLMLPDMTTYAGLRDKALICLTLDNGIRPKEAHQLRVDDFNKTYSQVIIRAEISKTGNQRILPITHTTVSLISKLISVRPKEWNSQIVLFASSDGTQLNKNTWRERMRKYSKMLDSKVVPYDLRHCFALNFLRNGGNALFLQKIMGHSDLAMTKKYIAATDEDLRKALQDASPLASFIKPKRIRQI